MSWQDKYLCPLIENERMNLQRIKKFLSKYFFLLKHSILPHESAREPQKKLPDITTEKEHLYDVCLNIYNESITRITKLEQKAFNLLSYITALFAFVSFMFLQAKDLLFLKIILLISMILLLISIIISFRCLSVKGIKNIFITDIYDLDSEPAEEIFDEKRIYKSYLQSSISNENVADNLADMLIAARYILMTALIFIIIGVGITITTWGFKLKYIDSNDLKCIK